MKKGWNKKGDSNLNTECPLAAYSQWQEGEREMDVDVSGRSTVISGEENLKTILPEVIREDSGAGGIDQEQPAGSRKITVHWGDIQTYPRPIICRQKCIFEEIVIHWQCKPYRVRRGRPDTMYCVWIPDLP